MVSTDNGRSWTRRSSMAALSADDSTCEPVIEVNQAGELVGVMRRQVGDWRSEGSRPSMYLVHSRDGGYTWSEPQTLFHFGVFPQLRQLENGVLVLSFGRPGTWVSFSLDGGHSWTQPQSVLTAGPTCCGYTSILALSADTFLLAYTEYREAEGKHYKDILVRRIRVEPTGR